MPVLPTGPAKIKSKHIQYTGYIFLCVKTPQARTIALIIVKTFNCSTSEQIRSLFWLFTTHQKSENKTFNKKYATMFILYVTEHHSPLQIHKILCTNKKGVNARIFIFGQAFLNNKKIKIGVNINFFEESWYIFEGKTVDSVL